MNPGYVLIQMGLVGKSFPTLMDLALIWLVVCVLIHVSFEATLLCEPIVADVALVRFLLGVSSHVNLKSLPLMI